MSPIDARIPLQTRNPQINSPMDSYARALQVKSYGQQNQLISAEDKYFQWLRSAVKLGVKARVFPRYFSPLLDRLMLNADALITLDQMGIGTTAYHIVCEKPLV